MLSTDKLNKTRRIIEICNSCRYCEGFCAVFPAIELRRTFSDEDLKYLSNLCHNCRDCYYACQYAPPHEFDINVPKSLAEIRVSTYKEFAWPSAARPLFARNGLWVTAVTLVSTLVITVLAVMMKGTSSLFTPHAGDNSFFEVFPYTPMILLMSALGLFSLFALGKGMMNFWEKTGSTPGGFMDVSAHVRAMGDVLRLKYLEGGGHGCNYPGDDFSMARRNYHHLVFYGFGLCFAATIVAAVYDHFLHLPSPYPFFSLPVILGTLGGLAMTAGTLGLFYLKRRMDRFLTDETAIAMDTSFIVLLLLAAVSGLALLVLREASVMGILLCLHLGIVAGLFITMPYGKFVHMAYRYAALVRNARESSRKDG